MCLWSGVYKAGYSIGRWVGLFPSAGTLNLTSSLRRAEAWDLGVWVVKQSWDAGLICRVSVEWVAGESSGKPSQVKSSFHSHSSHSLNVLRIWHFINPYEPQNRERERERVPCFKGKQTIIIFTINSELLWSELNSNTLPAAFPSSSFRTHFIKILLEQSLSPATSYVLRINGSIS